MLIFIHSKDRQSELISLSQNQKLPKKQKAVLELASLVLTGRAADKPRIQKLLGSLDTGFHLHHPPSVEGPMWTNSGPMYSAFISSMYIDDERRTFNIHVDFVYDASEGKDDGSEGSGSALPRGSQASAHIFLSDLDMSRKSIIVEGQRFTID